MMDKITMLSLLIGSLSFVASATEGDGEPQEAPAVSIENSSEPVVQDMSLEEPKDKVENLSELKDEKCKDKECDEEKMVAEEKSIDDHVTLESKSQDPEEERPTSLIN